MNGLGRFNFRKLLRLNPFAPPGAALFLQEKKKRFAPPPTVSPTATGVDTVTPAAPMPYYGYPYGAQQMLPQYQPGPFAPPQSYQPPVQQYQAPAQESATYRPGDYIPPTQPSAVDGDGPFNTTDTSPTALILDSPDDSMQGMGAAGDWSDIFTSAAQEVIAEQKAKRAAKALSATPVASTAMRKPSDGGGFVTTQNMLLLGAAGLAAFFVMPKLFKKRR